MANEINANINVSLNSSQALASLKSLQSQISSFNKSVIQSNAQAVAAQKGLVSTLNAQIGATRQFSTSMTTVETSVSRLQGAIDKNKLSMGEYFRFGAASSKNFSKIFKRENQEITSLATDRVKRLQTQYLSLGEAHGNMQKTMAVRPMQLHGADTAIAIQKQQIFNKLLKDGSTSILNWGKNTQWAGRQLMVGFTIPLTIFGGTAAKVFRELEAEAINFKKVYGDIFTTDEEVDRALGGIQDLSREFTKYGIAVKDTMALAGVAAQAGLRDEDLMAATTQATRLATLGQMEQTESIKTIISMQTAFQQSNDELAESVDFLNIIENQTVLSLQDVAGAIPRVAPVIKGMGGDVKDLAILLVAMREGGVSAAEGANALKNSLARLIDPTSKAIRVSKEFGINLEGIVKKNRGEVLPTITELAQALGGLEGPDEQKLLATIFGKFQYARIGALMKNIRDDSSQAARAMDLMGMSAEQLAQTADKELGVVEESVSTKFTASMEKAKLSIAPIGEQFLKLATPLLEGISRIFDKFNELGPTAKNFITILVAGLGVATPVILMMIGLFANFIGNALKGAALINNFFSRIRYGSDAITYLSGSQLDAAAAAASLEGKTTTLTSSLNIQADAVRNLSMAYQSYVDGARAASASLPQGFVPIPTGGGGKVAAKAMATGGMVSGSGNKDSEPALLTPGEFVINAKASKQFAPILKAINEGTFGKYNEGRTVSFGGQSFEAISTRSTSAIEKLLARLGDITESQKSDISSALQKLSSENSLSKKNLESQIALPIRNLTAQIQKAHVFDQSQQSVSAATARQVLSEGRSGPLPPAMGRMMSQIEMLEAAAKSRGTQSPVRMLPRTDLAVELEAGLNQGMRSAAGVNARDFKESFERSGIDKWSLATKMAGVSAEKAAPQFQILEERVGTLLDGASEAGLAIGDKAAPGVLAFGDIVQQATGQIKTSGQDVSVVEGIFSKLEGRTKTLQVSLSATVEELRELGFAAEQVTKMSSSGRVERGISVGQGEDAVFYRGQASRVSSPGAYRNVSVSDSDRLSGYVSSAATSATQTAVSSVAKAQQSSSPSRVARRLGEEFGQGYAEGIESQTAQVGKSSQALVTSGTSDIRKILKDRLGVGPLVEQELKNRRQQALEEERINRAIQRRITLITQGGRNPMAPGVAQRLAREQVLAEELGARSAASGGGRGSGSGGGTTFLGMPGMGPEGQGLANETVATTKRMAKTRESLGKFGNTLKTGSAKLTGVAIGLSSLAFMLSRVEGPVGDIAQKAMPVVFGLSSLQQIFPLIAKALPLLLNPVGLVVAALSAVAIVGFSLKKGLDNNISAGKKMADSMILASSEINNLAGFFGGKVRDISKTKDINQIAGLTPEIIEEGRKFVETEFGKTMAEEAKSSFERNASGFARNFANQLSMAIISGAITQDQARAVASGIGEALGEEELSANVIAQITQILGVGGEDITNNPMTILANVVANVEVDEDALRREAERSAQKWGDDFLDNLPLAELWRGQFDEAVRNSVAYTQSLISNAKALSDNIEYQIVAQQDKIDKLKEEIRLEQEKEKNAKTEDERKKASEARIIKQGQLEDAIAQRKKLRQEKLEVVDQRRAKLLEYMRSLTEEDGQLSDIGRETLTGMQRSVEAETEGLDVDKVTASARAAMDFQREEAGLPALDEQQQREIRYQMIFDLSIGAADPEASKIMDELYSEQGYSGEASKVLGITMDLRVQGDFNKANEIESIYANLGDKGRTDFLLALQTEGKEPEEVIAFGNLLLKLADDLPDKIRTTIIIAAKEMNKEELEDMSSVLEALGALPPSIKKDVNVETIGAGALKRISENYDSFQSKKNAKKQAEVVFGAVPGQVAAGLKAMEMSLEDFAKAPSSVKIAIAAFMSLELTPPGPMSPDAAERWVNAERLKLLNAAKDDITNNVKDTGTTSTEEETEDKKGAGGSKEKSFLEELKENLDANAKLYLNAEKGLAGYMNARGKFFGIFQQLRKKGVPENIIASLGTGPEAIKKARELLDMGKNELKKLMKMVKTVSIGEVIENARRKAIEDEQKLKAQKKVSDLPQELQGIVMADTEMIKAFATTKKGTPEYERLVKVITRMSKAKKDLAEITQTEEEAQISANQAVIDSLELQMKALELKAKQDFAAENGRTVDQVKEEIADREFLIKQYQRQIDEIERLNKKDQDRIDVLDRQKTLLDRQKDSISRQIEVLERANEMDQRRIEQLNRQDALRNRVADAINHELEIMSQQEEKINESYEKRFKALDKVAKVNDHLINQQKQQLGLSQAISEGDIYAATAAAQEMRASSAEFAREQLRSGMEDSRDAQIKNLVTSEGLTRDQAEERIRLIKEQSYQTSLQIRDIEDAIYERTQLTVPLKDQIYNLDLKIRDIDGQILIINDAIYNRNLEIKTIQDSQIDPLIRQNEESQFILDKLDNRIREESRQHRERVNQLREQNEFLSTSVKATGDLRDMTQKAKDKADNLAGSWRNVAKAARDAASAIGSTSVGAYAGGLMKYAMGGKVKKYPMGGLIPYAIGGVAGDGGRDSVNAMLTPGEFVVRKSMVNKYGIPMMEAINQGAFSMPRYGLSKAKEVSAPQGKSAITNNVTPVYNTYDMKFTVSGTNASADEIANKVMFKMKQVQSQGVRSNRGY